MHPSIITERLLLNLPQNSDSASIASALSKKVFYDNTLTLPNPYTEDSAKFWIQLAKKGIANQHYIFAIRQKEDNLLIGGIDLAINKKHNNAEIGYWIAEDFWNRGYATEAVKAIIDFGFTQLKLKRIYASHFDFNPASGKVLEKAGMSKEGILKCHTMKNNEYQNHVLYAIIRD